MSAAQKKTKRTQPYRFIDVHHHIIPPKYVSALASIGVDGSIGKPFPKSSPQISLDIMDKNNIATAITSLSTPGCRFKDDSFSRHLARLCNEFGAELISDYPGRFGAFAALPVPDVEGSLLEIEYALDTLKLDGVGLLSNVKGHYLGNPAYEEIYAELNRRKAVVFIHPEDLPLREGEPPIFVPIFERCVDTTRAIIDLYQKGIFKRYPNIRFIIAHGGGSVPYLAWRIALAQSEEANHTSYDRGLFDYSNCQSAIDEGVEILKRLYYDTAQPGAPLMKAIQELTGSSYILCGTDCGWMGAQNTKTTMDYLKEYDGFDEQEFAAVERNNALELFPRFKNNGGIEK